MGTLTDKTGKTFITMVSVWAGLLVVHISLDVKIQVTESKSFGE
jgi:hypothetical protein